MKLIFKKFQNLFPKPKGGVLLGNIKGPFKRKEELTEEQLNHHVHIVGASGYGKTVLLSHILSERMKQGKGLMLIDLKGDLDTLNKLTNAVVEANRLQDLKIFSLTDQKFSTPYNLLSRGTANQLRDRILLSLNWSEEYYKNQASSFVLKLLIILCWLRDEGKLGLHIGHVLECAQSKERIQYYGNMVPIENIKIRALAHELAIFLNEKDNYQSLQGLRSQLESITLSDFGELVTSVESGIDLYDSVNQGKIIFLFLDSRRYGETAKTMGRFILQDLKATSAKVDAEVLLENRKPFTVVVDEFADLASEDFIGFLDR
ncbi:MAG: helicase HerA-like domain-containing protein, partial [Pseudobdellovibrionaceae bacterium]